MLVHNFILIILTSITNNIFCQKNDFCNKNNASFEKDTFLNKTILGFLESQDATSNDVLFQWKVTATKTGICKNIQRCNLIARDAARLMEQHLKQVKYQTVSKAILIDNDRIVKGIDYTINLIILEGNKSREEKEFRIPSLIDLGTNKNRSDVMKSEDFLELNGANTTFSDLNYYITAKISSCNSASEGTMLKWELLDTNQEKIRTFTQRGTSLKIPPKTFSPESVYFLQCSLVVFNKILSKKIHKIEVLKREVNLKLNFKTLSVGKNQSIKLFASYESEDSLEDLKWKWICKNNGEMCKDFGPTDDIKDILEIQRGFPEIGSYEVTVYADNNGISKNATCIIKVVEIGSRKIEINKISYYVNPSEDLEILGKIYGLKVGCVAEWQSIQDDDYEFIDLNEIPNDTINRNISDNELLGNNMGEESSNYLDYDFILKIPTAKGNWKGLKGGKDYLLRLSSKCPVETSSPINSEEEFDEIYSDILIKTNPIPRIKPLLVTPRNGVALFTKFKFSTESGSDEETPLLYIFGYTIKNKTVYFDKISEKLSTETILPYTENGVLTVLKVCNNRMTCIETNGPIIKLTLPENITSETDEYITNTFHTNLIRGDYISAFSNGITLLETYKYFNNDLQLENLEEIIVNSVNQIFKIKISEEVVDDEFKSTVFDLIENTKTLAKFIKISPKILNSLIKLRAKLNYKLSANIITKNSDRNIDDMYSVLREINDKDILSVTFYDFQEYLLTSEFIISQTSNKNIINSIKNDIIEYVKKSLGQLCFLLYSGEPIKIDITSLNLQLDLINWNYFSNYVYVPNYYSDNKLLIKFDQSWFKDAVNFKLCVAKGIFKKYLQKSNDLFYVELFDADKRDVFIYDDLQNFVIIKGTIEQTCSVNRNNKWKICRKLKDANNNILCSCSDFGFYSVVKQTPTDASIQDTNENITRESIKTTTKLPTTKIKENTNLIQNAYTNNRDNKNVINQNKVNRDKNFLVTTEMLNTIGGEDIGEDASSQSYTNLNKNSGLSTSLYDNNDKVEMLIPTNRNDTQTSQHIVINYDDTTTSNTPIIKRGSFLSAGEFQQSDQISLILIGISVFGMILVGIFGGIMNRIKRERTVEVSDGVDFPKYADIFHKETMENM